MSAASLLIKGVIQLVNLYWFVLIVYILSTWIPQLRHSVVGEILAQLSEPYLRLFRGIIPPLGDMDFSPVLALLLLHLVRRLLDQVQWNLL